MDISIIVIYEFWYDYIKTKYGAKLCYTDTDRLIDYLKIHVYAAGYVERRLKHTSNYEAPRPLPKVTNNE